MKNEIENPFLDQGYAGPKYFCDREEETANIITALENGRNLTLMSPRRMGKTGLIKNAFHKLREQDPDTVTLYMDIFPTQNMREFIQLFASTVLGQLDSAPQKAMSRIAKFIKSIRPVITLDELSGLGYNIEKKDYLTGSEDPEEAKSRTEKGCSKTKNNGLVRLASQDMVNSKHTRVIKAKPIPSLRVRSCRFFGRALTNMAIITMLSTPRTISSVVRVIRAIQVWGSLNRAIIYSIYSTSLGSVFS